MMSRLPVYGFHKSSGQARCRINGKEYWLGPHGSPQSLKRYGEVIAQMADQLDADPGDDAPEEDAPVTLNELMLKYLQFAEGYYRKNNVVTHELSCIKSALKPVRELYGYTAAKDFSTKRFKVVQQQMMDGGTMCRRFINQNGGRIRRMFKWAVAEQMVPVAVFEALKTVAPLKAGRCAAKDHPARKPVPQASLEAVYAVVGEETADIMKLMLHSGARPGELCALTWDQIDKKTFADRGVWVAELRDHKTLHRGKSRIVVFGEQSQAILSKYLKADPSQLVFSITRPTLSNQIKAACAKAGVARYTAHWLRHNSLTSVRKEFGLDAAQGVAGHSSAEITQTYAALDLTKQIEVARKVG